MGKLTILMICGLLAGTIAGAVLAVQGAGRPVLLGIAIGLAMLVTLDIAGRLAEMLSPTRRGRSAGRATAALAAALPVLPIIAGMLAIAAWLLPSPSQAIARAAWCYLVLVAPPTVIALHRRSTLAGMRAYATHLAALIFLLAAEAFGLTHGISGLMAALPLGMPLVLGYLETRSDPRLLHAVRT